MNGFNTIGGILFASILSTNKIKEFGISNNVAVIKKMSGHDWHVLPSTHLLEAPVISPDSSNAQTIYKISVTLRLKRTVVMDTDIAVIRSAILSGCLINCQDCNGNKRIYGTPDFPLFGTLLEIHGKKSTDFSGYELTLAGISLYPQLRFIEL